MRSFSYDHLLKRTPGNEGLDGLCAVHTLAARPGRYADHRYLVFQRV
jgi:hypothetical protein